MSIPNKLLRREAKAAGVPLWKIARRMGIGEATITRRLRTELDETEKRKFLAVIAELSKEAEE